MKSTANLAFDRGQEFDRLSSVIESYGDEVGPFDARMRDYMMRTFELYFRDGKCLQVGCAHGDQTSLLLKRYSDLTVVEPTEEFIAHTRRRVGDRARFVQALVEDFSTEDRYEAIFFSHVLEHVIDPVAVLSALGNLLTPTGRLYIVVPNAEAPSRRIAVKMGALKHLEDLSVSDIAAGHRRVYRLDTLCRDAQQADLSIEHSGGIFFKPLANFQFDALIGGPLIGDDFMEGCYALGKEHPTMCASIYVIARRPNR
jgi:2-polyprenyl-3-methyl-5-hydroxy-6-metoxy-1,4-benzoquinol methylase